MAKRGSNTKIKSARILKVLDELAEECNFPILDNVNTHLGCIRLTAFRDETEWLIAFDEIDFDLADRRFIASVFGYGNKLERQGVQNESFEMFLPGPYDPWFDEHGKFHLDPGVFSIAIRGRTRRFKPTEEEYRVAGIKLRSKMPAPAKILRYLCHACRDELRLSDRELLQACGRQKYGLRKFLQVEDYYHPDLGGGELPGSTETFRSLAAGLEANDPKRFVPGDSNTHWSLWPDEPF